MAVKNNNEKKEPVMSTHAGKTLSVVYYVSQVFFEKPTTGKHVARNVRGAGKPELMVLRVPETAVDEVMNLLNSNCRLTSFNLTVTVGDASSVSHLLIRTGCAHWVDFDRLQDYLEQEVPK